MNANHAVDSWGFTDADHDELQALMQKYHAQMPDVILAVHRSGRQAQPDEPGLMGWIAREIPDAHTRVFPAGGFHRALLNHLRVLDDFEKEKGDRE